MSAITAIVAAPARAVATVDTVLSGTPYVDLVQLAVGDRVLIAGQATPSQNGLYDVAAGAWTRSVDFATSGQMLVGVLVQVVEGFANPQSTWMFTTSAGITVGTTALTFVKLNDQVDQHSGAAVPVGLQFPFPSPTEAGQNYDTLGPSLVASQYQKSPKLLATIAANGRAIKTLEALAVTIPAFDDPALAPGNPADPIGTPGPLDDTATLVGATRVLGSGTVLSDAGLRLLIAAAILRNNSQGTGPEFVAFVTFVFGSTPFRYYELGGLVAGIEIGTGGTGPTSDEVALLDKGPTTRAMAVGVGREWYDPTEWFAFAEDTAPNAKGFTEIGNPSLGGQFAEIF